MPVQPVLIDGQWQDASADPEIFRADNPATGKQIGDDYPICEWVNCDAALTAATEAFAQLASKTSADRAAFLRRYAQRIQDRKDEIAAMAALETGLPKSPRLADVELPRTTNQLLQAADAAESGAWSLPVIDAKLNIRSMYAPLGPVFILGPNNFPLAFNGVSGGDFAAAIAAGNPVIAKAHPSHPGTTRLLAEEAFAAVDETGLPAATVQMLYHLPNTAGLRMVADPRIGATAFTGSRRGGLALKAFADAAGKPIYLEMSSINPVIVLPGALRERGEKLAEELAGSCLLGGGQFCTKPGFVLLIASTEAEALTSAMKSRFESAPAPVLLARGVRDSLAVNLEILQSSGAQILTGGTAVDAPGFRFANTLLQVGGERFLLSPKLLQTEAFGNAALIVVAKNADQLGEILSTLEGNLTGSIYSDTRGGDDELYERFAAILRPRVGRLLNDKMPTGVAVSPAMNHGGPYPSTGHLGFTAVGIPASMRRFAMLQCFDNVRPERLPKILRD